MNGVTVTPFIVQFMFEGLFNIAKKSTKSMNSHRNTPKYIGDQKVKSLYKKFYHLQTSVFYSHTTSQRSLVNAIPTRPREMSAKSPLN